MKILACDKDPSVLALISTRLGARQFEVLECTASEDALRLLEKDTYDLILLSTDMERIAGQLLVQKIRDRQHHAAVPIIMMTEEDKLRELISSHERGFDDFLIKPFSPHVLQLRVTLNIARTRVRVQANALTHLPGNIALDNCIRTKIEENKKFSVLYLDINNFKSFNDRYGFEKGDDVIRQTAKILVQTRLALASEKECFVGHIGGDDFVVILDPEDEETYAKTFISEFDRIMPTYYNEEDQKRGSIRVTNRRGKKEDFPLMSCSVAACNNLHRKYSSLGEIARDAADLKSFLKTQPGSRYLRDRRSEPIKKLEDAVGILAPDENGGGLSKRKVDPLGQVLLNAGLISQDQLSMALKRHLETGQRLGQTLIAMNLVRSEDVGRMLEQKLNVPYVSLKNVEISPEVSRLFTFDFMKTHRVVPLAVTQHGLKLAMCDPFDIKVLDTMEKTSGVKPIPCLALEDEFEAFLDAHLEEQSPESKIV